MAVAYRSSAVANSGNSAVNSISVNAPAGVTPNDFIYVAIAYTGGSNVTITPQASGWTNTQTSNTGTTYGVQIFRKHAVFTEPTVYGFNLSSAQYVSAISVAYSGMRVFGAGGSYFPMTGFGVLDSSGTTAPAHSITSQVMAGLASRWVVSYNPSSVLSVSDPGSGLTKRADTSTTASSFIQLALEDSIITQKILGGISIPAATFSGSTTNNKSLTAFLRQDQTQVTAPTAEFATVATANNTTSGSITFSPSMAGEQGILVFHIGNSGSGVSVTSVTMAGTTWSLLAASQNPSNNTRTEVWTATLSGNTTVNNYTASWTTSAAAIMRVDAICMNAAGRIVNAVTASSDGSNNPNASLVTRGANSQIYGFISDTNGFVSTPSAPNNIYYEIAYSVSGTGTTRLVQQDGGTAGSTINAGTVLNASNPWSMVLLEVPTPSNTGNMLNLFN